MEVTQILVSYLCIFSVLLRVAVLDRLGAKTVICRIPLQVKPQPPVYSAITPRHGGHSKPSDGGDKSEARPAQRDGISTPPADVRSASQRL
ncbi:hypothetical protein ElyMa_005708600 [Elysia marginata]|uniref:Secreted protein n=1 Tax=Elysia marginata TaxID=1093978 RepID=A0AAV4FI10_9GAST|nr:hypothetical protein ElyMa_005708600 [Elysia marginata]